MIFPLLLAISRRLAALVPTALMSLMAIAAMLVFAKKAFLMSAAALAVSMYDSYKARRKQQKKPAVYYEIEEYPHHHVAEVQWKPSYSTKYSSYHKKKPSSYDVPIHSLPSSYYRQPAATSQSFPSSKLHSKDRYESPLDNHSPGDSGNYEVLDDYRPFPGGPAYVGESLSPSLPPSPPEQPESFTPFYPPLQGNQQEAVREEFQPLKHSHGVSQRWVRTGRNNALDPTSSAAD